MAEEDPKKDLNSFCESHILRQDNYILDCESHSKNDTHGKRIWQVPRVSLFMLLLKSQATTDFNIFF